MAWALLAQIQQVEGGACEFALLTDCGCLETTLGEPLDPGCSQASGETGKGQKRRASGGM